MNLKKINENVVWHQHAVTKIDRLNRNNQKACVVWLTGLSGSGKSTIASALDRWLFDHGYHSYVLDGDNVRHGLNSDLGFSDKDRVENIRRIAEVSKLMVDAGLIVITAFISPFRADRVIARNLFGSNEFCEVFVNTPLDVCEQRDPKGLYQKARKGQLKEFTGIDSPYEEPANPEVVINTAHLPVELGIEKILSQIGIKESLNKSRARGGSFDPTQDRLVES